MKISRRINAIGALLVALMLGAPTWMSAQQLPPADQIQLPADPQVRIGTLPNGLTYYIRHNEKPKGQADFYIAQKVGAIQEEDNQRGLAHFLEHMCFNGTKNFPGNQIVKWLETKGVKFGQNLNAYTAVDETVYNISNVPVTNTNVQDSCLLILHDWANELLLEPEEIDKERGVIHEEWRMRDKGYLRILGQALPTLYPGSKYAYRMPIGTMEIVDNFPYQDLRDYYEKWYRPDLQGIVVVGDIDVDRTEKQIKKMFSDIPKAKNPAKREYFPVPDHKGTIVYVGKDPEQSNNMVSLMWLSDPLEVQLKDPNYNNTELKLQQDYMEYMIATMLNNRLNELSADPATPYAVAYANFGGYLLSSRAKEALNLAVISKGADVLPAIEAAYRELLRAAQYGFTEAEYERAKADYLAYWQQKLNNKDSRENDEFVQTYVRNFLDKTPMLDITQEFMVANQYANAFPLDMLNMALKESITPDNRVIFATLHDSAPQAPQAEPQPNPADNDAKTAQAQPAAAQADKQLNPMPTDEELLAVMTSVEAEKLDPWKEELRTDPLIANPLPAGKIVSETTDEKWGTTTFNLSNGVKVIVKPTKFKEDEIIMTGFSYNGTNNLGPEFDNDIKFSQYSHDEFGLGEYTKNDLKKYLSGKQVGFTPEFGNYTTGLSGSATPKDLKSMMELLHMTFRDIRYNEKDFSAFQNTMKGALQHQESTPDYKFSKQLMGKLFKAPRRQPLDVAAIEGASAARTTEMARSVLANPADFTMIFVGNVNLDSIRPLLETYVASLPSNPAAAKTGFGELNPDYFLQPGSMTDVEKVEMTTPTTTVAIIETATMPFDIRNDKLAKIAGQILTSRLLKTVREEWGAVYSIHASGGINPIGPENVQIQSVFPMKPEEKDRVLKFIADEFKAMESNITPDELKPVQEFMVKNNREAQEQNGSWLGAINSNAQYGVDTFNGAIDVINSITVQDVMDFMKKLNAQNGYKVIIQEAK